MPTKSNQKAAVHIQVMVNINKFAINIFRSSFISQIQTQLVFKEAPACSFCSLGRVLGCVLQGNPPFISKSIRVESFIDVTQMDELLWRQGIDFT